MTQAETDRLLLLLRTERQRTQLQQLYKVLARRKRSLKAGRAYRDALLEEIRAVLTADQVGELHSNVAKRLGRPDPHAR